VIDSYWSGKRVLITGHTGFKGSWLTLYLETLGATILGLSLPPSNNRNLYGFIPPNTFEGELFVDIFNYREVEKFIEEHQPEIVFHLAAQASVLEGFRNPVGTWNSNVTGTQNLLESLRKIHNPVSVVVVTTDKVYLNTDAGVPFSEGDALGGLDPYSASKVAVENLVSSYRNVFGFENRKIRISTARAGNVIGGGDWLAERLIPDVIKSVESKSPFILRNPTSSRPWQHVLEPIRGYTLLAEALHEADANNHTYESPFNFSCSADNSLMVSEIIAIVQTRFGLEIKLDENRDVPHESKLLSLNSKKSEELLSWKSILDTPSAVNLALDWYIENWTNIDMRRYSINQILNYAS
jgi:CDP-glucose 4,6-dehydratase